MAHIILILLQRVPEMLHLQCTDCLKHPKGKESTRHRGYIGVIWGSIGLYSNV